MLDAFRDHLERSGLVPPGASVLVGYSGGPDSTALVHLLKRASIDVVAAHLEHGQRPEAAFERDRCAAFADELGVPFASGKADVPAIARQRKIGLEEAGREARYEFFRRAALGVGAPLIATGHTRDDQIETVLFRLARGVGYGSGLGIPGRRGEFIRPLLPFSKAQTRQYCDDLNLWYHNDPANTDQQFARARVRHRLVPEFQAVHPGAEEALLRFAHIAEEESRFLDQAAAAALEHAESPLNGDLGFLTQDVELAFDRQVFASIPSVLMRRALRLAALSLGESLDFAQIHLASDSLRWEEKGSVTAEGGRLVVEWSASRVHMRLLDVAEPFRYPLTAPGETESEVFGWRLQVRSGPAESTPKRADLRADFGKANIKGELHFRSAQDGDRMIPLGFDRERKLADLLSEAQLSGAARRRLPIICDMLGPLWAPGVCLAERARPNSAGSDAWKLEFGPWTPRETERSREA